MHGNFRNDTKRALTKYGGDGGWVVIEYSLYYSLQVIRTTERSEGERRRARVPPPGHLSYLRMMIGMIKAVTDRQGSISFQKQALLKDPASYV